MEFLELMRFLLDAKDKFPDLEWSVDRDDRRPVLELRVRISEENADVLADAREMFGEV